MSTDWPPIGPPTLSSHPKNRRRGHPKNTTGKPTPPRRMERLKRRKKPSAQKNCRPLAGAAAIESSSAGRSQNRLPADGLRQRQTRRPAISGAASWYSRYASLNHLLWLRGIPAVAVPARTPPPGGFLPSRHWGPIGRKRPNRCLPGPSSTAKKSLGGSSTEGQIYFRQPATSPAAGDENVRPRYTSGMSGRFGRSSPVGKTSSRGTNLPVWSVRRT